jgi:ABC-type uncharacterized transport system permease subunit
MSTLIIIGTILSNTLLYATPLIFAALGGVFSERSGVVNIGLEGLMTIGAFSAAVTTIDSGSPWLGLVVALVAGAIFAIPHAIASISFQADQVVSGVALNFLGGGISLFLTKMLFNGAAQTQTVEQPFTKVSIGGISNVPILGDILNAYPTTYLAIALVVLTYVLLYKTPWGLRLRSVGEHPRAADTLGINVYRMRYTAVIISGALAGIGGACMSIAITSNFTSSTISGHGFMALAAMIFGKWRPFGAMWACLFFGFATSLAATSQILGLTRYVPNEWLNMLPYILTILALAGVVGRAEAPAADGKPYKQGER